MLQPAVGRLLGRHGVEFAFFRSPCHIAVGDAPVGMQNHRNFTGLVLQSVGMAVKLLVNVRHFLSVCFEEIRVDQLKIICVDLFPAQAGTILAEIYELSVADYYREQQSPKEKQVFFHAGKISKLK